MLGVAIVLFLAIGVIAPVSYATLGGLTLAEAAYGDGGGTGGGCCGGDRGGDRGGGGDKPQPKKPVCTLNASPDKVKEYGQTKLSWTTANAYKATINKGVGSVSIGSGSKTVSVKHATTYTMTVVGRGGTATCQTTVKVVKKPSCEIWAHPEKIKKGEESYLEWKSSNAMSAFLEPGGSVSLNGMKDVYPYKTTTYTLWVVNKYGQKASCETTVKVKKGYGHDYDDGEDHY